MGAISFKLLLTFWLETVAKTFPSDNDLMLPLYLSNIVKAWGNNGTFTGIGVFSRHVRIQRYPSLPAII
jgi:hypothetical protein